jgi:beta-glucanase (GH16 family)
MIRFIQIALVVSILVGTSRQVYAKTSASYRGCEYLLTFHDEFNGTNLDTTKWNSQYPSGNGGEQQFYTPDAITLQDGILKIAAEKHAMQGYPYTSGIITTQGTFSQQYGFFSMRAKLPKGQGFWPAFWMLPAKPAYPAEIDVFEMLGGNPSTIYMSNHWKGADQDHQKNIISYQGPDFSLDFHTYSLLWNPAELIWYVDGVEQYRTSEGIPSMPMFLLANLAVGGNWPGNPDETTSFPSSMEIDYIRAYKYQCGFGLAAGSNPMESFIHGNTFESFTPGQHHS